MALELKQSVRMAQQLVVTPQLQQAIKLLQLSRLELAELIEEELTENPVLEDAETEPDNTEKEKQSASEKVEQAKDEDHGHDHSSDEVVTPEGALKEPSDFDWSNYLNNYSEPVYTAEREIMGSASEDAQSYENISTQSETLHDHLLWQLRLSSLSPSEQDIGAEIIGNINDDGYLKASIEEISSKGFTTQDVEKILKRIQEFDPTGVGARDLKECLLLQVKQLGQDSALVSHVIESCLPDLERHDYISIAKKMDITQEKAKEISHLISALDPKPGSTYGQELPQYITPDVYVYKSGDNYIVSLNEDGMPKLKISEFYRRSLMKGSGVAGQTREYIQDRLRSAVWLIKSIHQRQRTLYRVTSSIVKFQKDFFDKGLQSLKPLVLKNVADDIEMHESTISRVTANKFVHTPRGIYELKFFFNSGINQLEGGGIASEVVKMLVKKMIAMEDNHKPLSDQDIAIKLKNNNIDMARRTVAKYRETLGIPSSSKRRRID